MKFFRDKLYEDITIPAPPKDDMAEAKVVKKLISNRTAAQEKSIADHDRVPFYAIKKYCEDNKMIFHPDEFKDLIQQATDTINYFKDKYDRKRPIEVDKTLDTLPSKTNKTPSYPSGHAVQSRIVAKYVGGKFPEHEVSLIEAGNECGYGRVLAGFHYPSDYEVGNLLGDKMYELMNKDDYIKEMKTFRTFRESIIDMPRSTYAPGVFDDADTNNPKLKQKVLDIVKKDLETFEKFGPVVSVKLIGSILGKRYRNDADLDIDVLIDLPKDEVETVGLEARKSVSDLNGKNIPGTKHPINYYVQSDPAVNDAHLETASGIFDVFKQKFDKRPKEETFDPEVYQAEFEKKVNEIDVVKGELKRDVIDYDELNELQPGQIKNLQKRIQSKLKEIENAIEKFSVMGDELMQARRDLFNTPLTPQEIQKYGVAHKLPKNVIFKYLEKYHYITFFKRCKDILKDGEVSDAEIDSLKGGYTEQAQSKTRAVNEALDKKNKLIFAFGRFNPPTTGHGKLMREVTIQARKNGANHVVYASASQDKRKNPLDVKTKVKFMKKMFPDNKILAAGGTQRTFMEILKFYDKMYGEIIMVAGSDRISEFQKLCDKYNGKDYNYKSIKVVSSGERDPDAEGVTGMSASKMRDMAKSGDAKNFKNGVEGLSDSEASSLFNAVRKGMGITGRNYPLIKASFTEFVNNDLREEYHQEKIFNVGDMVEHMDGSKGMVVRRGSNYVSYENDGLIKKAWLYDLQELEEEPRVPRKKGQPAGSDKHSDLYTDENPKGTIKGLGFKDTETASASVSKIKNSGKTHAHKIQAAVAMEQRAKEMGKSAEAAIYRKYINQMKDKTKEMNKESFMDTLEKEMDMNEYYEIGTDKYAQHTMRMTPGQPIQNFRKYSETIKMADIEKFRNEEETIDKYKKRYKERYKEELEKAVQRMKKEL